MPARDIFICGTEALLQQDLDAVREQAKQAGWTTLAAPEHLERAVYDNKQFPRVAITIEKMSTLSGVGVHFFVTSCGTGKIVYLKYYPNVQMFLRHIEEIAKDFQENFHWDDEGMAY